MSPLLASWAVDAVLVVHGLFIAWVVLGAAHRDFKRPVESPTDANVSVELNR